jgi:uncharacterized protein
LRIQSIYLSLPSNFGVVDLRDEYVIAFEGLKNGVHLFDYQIDLSFFESSGMSISLESLSAAVQVSLNKQDTMLLFEVLYTGEGFAPCDRCLVPYNTPISGNYNLVVRLGEEEKELGDGLVEIPRTQHAFDIRPFVYDSVCLNLPLQIGCKTPGKKDNPCDMGMLSTLEKYQYGEANTSDDDIDPRWEALKKLKP